MSGRCIIHRIQKDAMLVHAYVSIEKRLSCIRNSHHSFGKLPPTYWNMIDYIGHTGYDCCRKYCRDGSVYQTYTDSEYQISISSSHYMLGSLHSNLNFVKSLDILDVLLSSIRSLTVGFYNHHSSLRVNAVFPFFEWWISAKETVWHLCDH